MQLRQLLRLAGEDTTGDVGGETTGEHASGLSRDSAPVRNRRTQGLGKPIKRVLVLETGGARCGEGLDEEQVGKRRIGGEESEPRS